MVDMKLVLVLVAVAASIWIGDETVKGVKWVGHKVTQGVHKVVHPHRSQETSKDNGGVLWKR